MANPFVAPIPIEVKIKIIGVEFVNAAYACSPNKFPIQRLSTRLYAIFKNIAIIIGTVISSKHFFVFPFTKSIFLFILIPPIE